MSTTESSASAHTDPATRAGDPFVAAATAKDRRVRALLSVLLSSCAECGTRDAEYFVPVPGDHLTFFAGDELCPDCAANHGVL